MTIWTIEPSGKYWAILGDGEHRGLFAHEGDAKAACIMFSNIEAFRVVEANKQLAKILEFKRN